MGSSDGSAPEGSRSLVGAVSADLIVVVALLGVGIATVLTPTLRIEPVQTLIGLLYVSFVPGYVLSLVLFPAADGAVDEGNEPRDATETSPSGSDRPGETGIESISALKRLGFAAGASFVLVAVVGTAVSLTSIGEQVPTTILVVSVVTLVVIPVALRRRAELPPAARFRVSLRTVPSTASSALFRSDSRADLALTLLFVTMLLLAAGSVGYAVTAPKEKGTFSEFYLLTTNQTGDLVADDYPTEFVAGEPRPIVVGIGNQEYEPVTYTVIVELQNVRLENNRTVVLERERLQQFSPTVSHNDTWLQYHQIEPEMTGTRLRLTYLLYRDAPPATPTTENAYRDLRLWINVSAPQGTNANALSAPQQANTNAVRPVAAPR
ncbi:DUF1616 domain-containing protein [Salinigranum sp. GCM10025319]|uniref:DUF1616 domain-containing protein n=1 Tax=Salinigranum sp. GCM10025319 TaxID=3252687 RepID=UPI0036139945